MMIQTSKVSCEIEKIIINRLIHTFFLPDSSCPDVTTRKKTKKSDHDQRSEGRDCDLRVHLKLCCVALI